MPATKLVLDFKGLVTSPGQLAAAPGALTVAENVNFPAPGIAEKRKGFAAAADGFTGPCWAALNTKQLGANVLFNTSGAYGLQLQYGDGTAPPTTITTPDTTSFTGAVNARMKGSVSLKNHYLTSTRAPGRLESDYEFFWAGMPRPFGMFWSQQNVNQLVPAAGSFLANGYAVAYRSVWVMTDQEGVEIVSAPSGRWVVANVNTTAGWSGADAATKVRVAVPYQSETIGTAITVAWTMRLYRSIAVDTASAQPSDEMQLCYEGHPTAGQITAGYMQIEDNCPEAALGAYLYTNTVSGGDVATGLIASGAVSIGMAASNDRPPLAKDVASYANCTFWANFTTPQRLQVSILATGAGGLAVGDVLTLSGATFTGVAGAPASAAQFRVETALGSVTLNIRQTAMNLVSSINTGHPNITASYIGSDASPGTIGAILLEARRGDRASFALSTSGVATAFLPSLDAAVSSQDTSPNGIAFSKPLQADAVPPANYITVGDSTSSVLRIIPLRDALYVFTDGGIYWVRGDRPSNFGVDAFDTTFRLLARDAAVAVGDAIYAWGREGLARITNGGVEFLDLPIRNFVQACQRGLEAAITLDTFAAQAFAVAYPVQQRVLFFFPNGTEDDGYGCTRALVFHIQTGAWSTYRFDPTSDTSTNNRLSACVRWSDERLVSGEYATSLTSQLYIERATQDSTDYADTTLAGAEVAIPVTLKWMAMTPNPSQLCHWSEVQVYLTPGLYPEGSNTSVDLTILSDHLGTATFDMDLGTQLTARAMLSPAIGLATWQTVTVAQNVIDKYLGLAGLGLIYHPVSNFMVR